MVSLAEKMDALVDAQIKTEEQMRRLDKASRERDRLLDERIQNLVSAIGEFIRRNGENR